MSNQIASIGSALAALPSKCTEWAKDHPVITLAATIGCVTCFSLAVAKDVARLKAEREKAMWAWTLRPQPPAVILPPISSRRVDHQFSVFMQEGQHVEARKLLQQGANPNAFVGLGSTPLSTAILKKDLACCKILIDMGAYPQGWEGKALQKLWVEAGVVSAFAQRMFMTRRPPFYEPQLFFEGGFQSLEGCAAQYLQEPRFQNQEIFLLIVGDEKFNQYYGGVTGKLTESFHPFYGEAARDFAVVRALVDKPHQLVPVIDKVQALLPERMFVYLDVEGHGNWGWVRLGQGDDDVLSMRNVSVIKAARERFSPFTMISFSGCHNAYAEHNVVQQLSRELEGCIFGGSYHLVQGLVLKTFDSQVLQKKVLVLGFPLENKTYLKLYANGECLACLDLPEGPLPPQLIQTFEDHFASRGGIFCGKSALVAKDYFA